MLARATALLVLALLLLLLAACGTTAPGPTGPAATATRASAAPTAAAPPRGQKPPRPAPDPAAVAAGAPLRAILLAQIDDYERALAPCAAAGTPVATCGTSALRGLRPRLPELDAYVAWRDAIWYCIGDGQGGYTRVNTLVYLPPTPAELREPGTLDVYVAGAAWCDQSRPRETSRATDLRGALAPEERHAFARRPDVPAEEAAIVAARRDATSP
jgi:hypothetical protein